MRLTELFRQSLTLSTPKGRVFAWIIATLLLLLIPYTWLSHLSLWQRLGLDWAPSIGLTRAYWLLIHGQPAAAVDLNALIIPVCVIGLVVLTWDLRRIKQSTVPGEKAYTSDISL
jgi:hypothetical protein